MSILRDFPDLPPIWAAGTAAASLAVGRWFPLLILPDAAFPLGALLILAGILLAAWAALWFWRKKTSIEPRERPARLIVEGPFRINRNPIYSGMALAVFGIALMAGTLGGALVALLFPFVVTARFIKGEEAALRAAFGSEAESYMARTRRW